MKILNKQEGEIYKILDKFIKERLTNIKITDETLKNLSKYFPNIYGIFYLNPKYFKNKDNKHIIEILKLNKNNFSETIKTYYL